ncbi:MAG: flavodoxin domain-containing protein [Carbonactinosporaceae bacterium]
MTSQRVLVAYATKHGSTAEIAAAVADTVMASGLNAEVRPASDIRDVEGYSAVILGSPVYMTRWRREALVFGRRHHSSLCERPVWLFSSGPLDDSALREDIPAPRAVARLARQLGARGHVTFGGCLTADARGFLERRLVQTGRAGDFRDFEQIRAWARKVAAELQRPASERP